MRTSMQWLLAVGNVAAFGLSIGVAAKAAEFPALSPTYVAGRSDGVSPYSAARPVRVTYTNRDGQQTTLEYRKPVKLASYEREDELVPVTSLPVLSSPARAEDLDRYPEITTVNRVQYVGQPVAPPTYRQVNYQATPTYAWPQAAPTQVHYAPAPTYALPNYSQPVVGAPYTVYSPIAAAPSVAQPNVQVGSGIYGQPVIYRPGQPLRNVWRWLTP